MNHQAARAVLIATLTTAMSCLSRCKSKSKHAKKKLAEDSKKDLAREKEEFDNKVNRKRLALKLKRQHVRMKSKLRNQELEQVIEGERLTK